ncbi:hypothetical protein PX699_23035 [Sphingobium sp. H39-3-25]|uniref:ATP-grasp domain-containing protein n=1 Tax=Sphingobium arseniciresistens TaxID=3030834 RepID=UPI0023B9FA0F|nr:hypothetical protein [Sphingobium arseniciresistens]
MGKIALVSARASLANDHDMPLLLDACVREHIDVEVCFWDDGSVQWSSFDAVVLRSPWDYTERLPEFLAWCQTVAARTVLQNPPTAVRWSLDKHYLGDLEALGVAVVPTHFIQPSTDLPDCLREYLYQNPTVEDFVIKPAIGCYSKGVHRYSRRNVDKAEEHVAALLSDGATAIVQPYLKKIDQEGETNLIYFNGEYSHAIRKGALLDADGTVNVPTNDFRAPRIASQDERAVAEAALSATAVKLQLDRPLLYARIDLIRDQDGSPRLLELEIAEPSLSLQFAEGGAERFAVAISKLTLAEQGA